MARPDRFAAYDKVSGETFDWGEVNFVRLEPWRCVAHILAVRQG
jgi:starch synthase (maltosyl-transferring)